MSVRRCPTCSEELSCSELDDKHFICGQCGSKWKIERWEELEEKRIKDKEKKQ